MAPPKKRLHESAESSKPNQKQRAISNARTTQTLFVVCTEYTSISQEFFYRKRVINHTLSGADHDRYSGRSQSDYREDREG